MLGGGFVGSIHWAVSSGGYCSCKPTGPLTQDLLSGCGSLDTMGSRPLVSFFLYFSFRLLFPFFLPVIE